MIGQKKRGGGKISSTPQIMIDDENRSLTFGGLKARSALSPLK
jgi:hypothetical protein